MVATVECPHCFTLVYPRSDGSCPAFQLDTRDTHGIDPERTTVIIGEHSQLPDLCCECGLPARRTARVRASKPVDGDVPAGRTQNEAASTLSIVSLLLGPLGALIDRLVNGGPSGWNNFWVSITQCDECATLGAPTPLRADYEHFTMRFVVHRNFQRQFEALNDPSDGRAG